MLGPSMIQVLLGPSMIQVPLPSLHSIKAGGSGGGGRPSRRFVHRPLPLELLALPHLTKEGIVIFKHPLGRQILDQTEAEGWASLDAFGCWTLQSLLPRATAQTERKGSHKRCPLSPPDGYREVSSADPVLEPRPPPLGGAGGEPPHLCPRPSSAYRSSYC